MSFGCGVWNFLERGMDVLGHLLMLALAVNGLLKGYDALMNLVLDEVQEVLRGMAMPALLILNGTDDRREQMTKAIPPPGPSVSSLREERYWYWSVPLMEVRRSRIRSCRLRNERRILETKGFKHCEVMLHDGWRPTNMCRGWHNHGRQTAWEEYQGKWSDWPAIKAMIKTAMQKTRSRNDNIKVNDDFWVFLTVLLHFI